MLGAALGSTSVSGRAIAGIFRVTPPLLRKKSAIESAPAFIPESVTGFRLAGIGNPVVTGADGFDAGVEGRRRRWWSFILASLFDSSTLWTFDHVCGIAYDWRSLFQISP